ncbi:MAG: LPS assembly protein LptD [Nitrospirota bacterium]
MRLRAARRAILVATSFLLLTLVPLPSAAQVPELGELKRLQESFQTRGVAVEISADEMSYSREQDVVTGEGHVRLSQGTLSLEADRALLYRRTGRVTATGSLRARDGDDTFQADSLDLDLTTRSGVMTNGRFFLARDHYFITGTRIERRADESYVLETATITSCDDSSEPGGRTPWKIKARKLRVEPEQYLTARDVVFSVFDVPVIYLPYILWPVKTERQSGLLAPSLGYSTAEGVKIRQPLYITLGHSQDLTVTLDERTQRGTGVELEYRYKLSRRSQGVVEVDFFRDDELDLARRRVAMSQVIQFNERLELRLAGEYLSDDTILRDLASDTADRTKQFVESNLFLSYRDAIQSATGLVRFTRDLANPTADETQLLPQIVYRLPSLRVARAPLFVSAEGSYTNFWRYFENGEGTTQRYDAFSVAVWRQDVPLGVVLTPRVGVRETAYRQQDESLGGDVTRTLGIAGLGAASQLRRVFAPDRAAALVHTLEPALLYTYIGNPHAVPYPQFDEIDSIQEQNLVTATLTNRLVAPGRGASEDDWEPLWVRFTQTYRLAYRPAGEAWSALRGEAAFRSRRVFQLDIDAFFDHALKTLTVFDTELHARDPRYGDIAVGHRSTRPDVPLAQKGDILDPLALGGLVTDPHPEIDYYTISARAYLPLGFEIANKTYYNRQTGKYTEIAYGLQYRAQCWSITFTYQDFPDKNEFSVTVTLLGATSVTSNVMSDLFGPQPTR